MQQPPTNNHNEGRSSSTRLGRSHVVLKLASAALVALALSIGLSSVGGTVSYFSDVEKSIGNYLRADPLYFSVEVATTTLNVGDGPQMAVPAMAQGEASDPVQYWVASQMTGGDAALCSALHVLATAPFPYDGPLLGLATGYTTDTGPWALTLSVPPDFGLASTSCSVDLIYTGWNASSTPGQGYSDTEKVSLMLMFNPAPAPSDASAAAPADAPTAPQDATSTAVVDASATSTTPVADATTTDATPSTGSTGSPETSSGQASSPQADATSTPDVSTPPPADPQSQ